MDSGECKSEFYRLVAPSYPNEWEVDEAVEILALTGSLQRQALLSHVPAIWPVSHSLCFSFLAEGIRGLSSFPVELLPEWVRQILARYEEGGLRAARDFMSDVEKSFLDPLRGRAGVPFAEMIGRMLPYIRGVSGMPLELAVDASGGTWTDTRTIYLPDRVNLFPNREDNLLFYKLIITLQWGFIAVGTYRLLPESAGSISARDSLRIPSTETGITDYFSSFSDPKLAEIVFHLLEFSRVFALLKKEFPGLVRHSRSLCLRLLQVDPNAGRKIERIGKLLRGIVAGDCLPESCGGSQPESEGAGVETFQRLPGLFAEIHSLAGESGEAGFLPLLGRLNFSAAQSVIALQRKEERERCVKLLAAVLAEAQGGEQSEEKATAGSSVEPDALVLVPPSESRAGSEANPRLILINNEEMILPDELTRIIERIETDLGEVPLAYIQAAVGMAGRGRGKAGVPAGEEGPVNSLAAFFLDEWDYRRAGYRKNWCCLFEKELPLLRSNFVPVTLRKYGWLIAKVKRQFEMLRTAHRFVRRRRYGDDLDFDALIEALGDQRAGFAPSDRVFIRLLRDERDIAALFLVDMSNSTEGWIGTLIKESLVLLGEAMDVVGDRYGIYGFSGMRRSRCELFHIKHFDEVYGDEVRQRIAAITPREYTRMGAPIRHLSRMLRATDARLRLLIALTDGKPEDYDGYNDDYAIEDTRKALAEARGAGIHPFCINIDQQASGYLRHMYGEGNYIFVNKIENLPVKMADFYRMLTS